MTRPKVQGYVSRDMEKALDRHVAQHPGQSKSSVIEASLKAYLTNTTDTDLLYRRLDRHTRSLAKVSRDVEMLQEALAVFVKLWFAHTPRVAESERENAQVFAEGRYQQFCDYVGRQLASGHAFVDDIATDLPLQSKDEPHGP
jgi:hypothetical protein